MGDQKSHIYADYNGTTPPAPEVVSAIHKAMTDYWANPNSDHEFGKSAKDAIEHARRQVAAMVGGKSEEIIFTSGGTESNNMVLLGICHSLKDRNPHVITTNVEHVAISLPLKYLQKTVGVEVSEVNVTKYETIVGNVFRAVKPNTVLISIMAANNETGVIFPLRDIGHRLKSINIERQQQGLHSIIFHSDAAQIIGKEPFDVSECELDCATIVGHKFYGPRIGALWSRVPIPPLLFGGGCEKRPGTDNTPMIVGLGVAASLVTSNLMAIREKILEAKMHLEARIKSLPAVVKINCEKLPRLVNTCSLCIITQDQRTGREILRSCNRLLASVGAACHSHDGSEVSQVLINSGIPVNEVACTIRLSLGRDATIPLVEEIIKDLDSAVR